MRPLLTPAEMKAADEAAIAADTPAATLMERAGRAVAHAVIAVDGRRYGKRVAIVCGPGNNGGDGFVAARALAAQGVAVSCLAVGDVTSTSGAAAESLARLSVSRTRVDAFDRSRLDGADVVVDALFGTGFRGAAEGDAAKAIEAINDARSHTVAVDIPSGVDGETGAVGGPAVAADDTVVMQAEKLGTALAPGAALAGRVLIVDIGIPIEGAQAWMAEPDDVARVLPRRSPDAHKRSGGSVVLLAGSGGMTGAAVLTARAAARTGAGYVTLGATREVQDVASAMLPEVLTEVVADDDVLGPEALDGLDNALSRATAAGIGPGLGQGDAQRELVVESLKRIESPVVVDADGLNVLGAHPGALSERTGPTVITPHPGELGRLMDISVEDVQHDRLGRCRDAAHELGCVVLLKGYRTVVAHPDGRVVVNPTGGAELATAGTGDVLTGIVVALLAAGLEPFEAAWAGAYLHGAAGEIAAREHGVSGVLAWDVAEAVPRAVRSIH